MKVIRYPSTRIAPLILAAVLVVGVTVGGAAFMVSSLTGDGATGARGAATVLAGLERGAASPVVASAPFRDETGASVTLRDFRGKIVVLNFWATWCPPCIREMPSLDTLHGMLGGDRFAVVAVSTDRRESMAALRTFYDKHDLRHLPLYQDAGGALARSVGIDGLPTTLILDQDGRLLGTHTGYVNWLYPELVDWIKARMAAIP